MPDSPPPTDPTVEKVAEWLDAFRKDGYWPSRDEARDLLDSCSLVPRSELEQVEADLAEMRAARSAQEDATTEQTFKAQRLKRELEQVERERDELLDAVQIAVQELPLTRVGSKPSDHEDGPSRAGARLRLALKAVRDG